jgi:hypothetical protein
MKLLSNKDKVLSFYETNRINFVDNNFYNDLPEFFKGDLPSPFQNMGLLYKDIIEPYVDEIVDCLNDSKKTEVKQTYNGKPVRIVLKDKTITKFIVEYFENLFNTKVNEIQVNRNCVTDVPSYLDVEECDKNNYWISQYWHIDNYPHKNFSVGIYLNDVEDGGGQFEYLNNPEYYYYNNCYKIKFFTPLSSDWKTSRINLLQLSDDEITKVLGPRCTTFFFIPNFIHRGTFSRTKQRDFIRLLF